MAILSVMSISCYKTSLGGDGSGNGGNNGPLPELSPLEEIDNVCDKMDDLKFMTYCYENFDVNKDGKVSMSEASAVEDIVCNKASSFAGLEYFNNLKNFESHSVETADFRYNTMLETIDCSESKVTKVDLRYNKNLLLFSFDGCSLLTSIGGIPDSVSEIGNYAFRGCSSLADIDIPDGVTEIGSYAFSGCSSLTAIDIPNNITEISSGTFKDCSSLTTIDIPDSVTKIDYDAFIGCSSLTDINIPDSITEIGGGAFKGCSSLTAIEILYGIKVIDRETFLDCNSLRKVNAKKCYALSEIESGAFFNCPIEEFLLGAINVPEFVVFSSVAHKPFSYKNHILKVPAESVEAYKNSEWAEYFETIEAL